MSDDFKPTVWMLPACIDAYAYKEPLGQFRLLQNPPIGAQLMVTLEDHERAVAEAVAKERERCAMALDALRELLDAAESSDSAGHGTLSTCFVREICSDILNP